MRPLFYDFPEDKTCWDNESEYMFGPQILVAPVMERGQKTKEVLSAGRYKMDKTYGQKKYLKADRPLQ